MKWIFARLSRCLPTGDENDDHSLRCVLQEILENLLGMIAGSHLLHPKRSARWGTI